MMSPSTARVSLAAVVAALLLPAHPTAAQDRPQAAPPVLRVCADPNNLPFSNRAGEGFENRIAELLARDLGARVTYTWHPEGRGLVRKTLTAGTCDVLLGLPAGYDPALTTRPYYRSTYVFVTRADRKLDLGSLDDPRLRTLRIGVHVIGDDFANTPPVAALAARGITRNLVGYRIVDDYSRPDPPTEIVDAVARGDIDVAIVWGPIAGFAATRAPVRLRIAPLPDRPDPSGMRFAFALALGVRRGDVALARRLDAALERERGAIRRILTEYGVPLLPQAPTAADARP